MRKTFLSGGLYGTMRKPKKWMMEGDRIRSKKGIPRKFDCYTCHRACKGKSWKIRLGWGGNKPKSRRVCFSCGHMVLDFIEEQAKKLDNSHLPMLEL